MTVYQRTAFTPELTGTGYALFRAGVKISAGTAEDLAASLRRRHEKLGTRWRLLAPLAQADRVLKRPDSKYSYRGPNQQRGRGPTRQVPAKIITLHQVIVQ